MSVLMLASGPSTMTFHCEGKTEMEKKKILTISEDYE